MATVIKEMKCPICGKPLRHEYYGSFSKGSLDKNGYYCKKRHGPFMFDTKQENE